MEKENREIDLNKCKVCGKFFVVKVLARCCEDKHNGVVFIRSEKQVPKEKS